MSGSTRNRPAQGRLPCAGGHDIKLPLLSRRGAALLAALKIIVEDFMEKAHAGFLTGKIGILVTA